MINNITYLELTGQDPNEESFVSYWVNLKKGNKYSARKASSDTGIMYNGLIHMHAQLSSGKKMEVITYGNGSPILFISGIGMITPIWFYQIKPLSSGNQLVFIHNPGHGLSEITEDLSYQGVSKTIIETLEVLGITSPFHILGTCLGGNIAAALAAFSQQCISLTLVNTVYDYATDAFDDKKLNRQKVADMMDFLKGFENRLRTDFDNALKERSEKNCDMSRQFEIYIKSKIIDPYAYLQYVDNISKNKVIDDLLREIRQPTLVLASEKDTAVDIDNSKKISRLIKKSKYIEMHDAGHYPYITHPSEFNMIVKSFIDNVAVTQ